MFFFSNHWSFVASFVTAENVSDGLWNIIYAYAFYELSSLVFIAEHNTVTLQEMCLRSNEVNAFN